MRGTSAPGAGLHGPRPIVFAAAALALSPALTPATAADSKTVQAAAGGPVKTHFLSLGIGKSVIIDLPRDIKDVLVADPKIANAVVRSPQRAYVIGETVGQTNVVFLRFRRPAGRLL